ncbi:uncharacterized protein LOC133825568 [Humulus lupulus]|uniref:uncharacterized protein LOC133825568 n=1 Tax=Humulus lupulus TaxID=3486 RepID=UPI002B40CEED|nr:uncharacterized protein LOC133825568 [Humulus lupulus]
MVLNDTGGSVNILCKSSMERMKLLVQDLEPCNHTIYGFTKEGLTPAGSIRLLVTTGTTPGNRTILATFIVVNFPSAYNVVIGRPILVDLQVVMSIWYLAMKFPTDSGIRYVFKNQREVRECYNSSITKAKKGGENTNMIFSSSPSVDEGKLQVFNYANELHAQSGDQVTK